MQTLVLDLEANALDPYKVSAIWCISTFDITTKERRSFVITDGNYLDAFKDYVSPSTQYIGHNLLGYDRIVLHRLAGVSIPTRSIQDTLVLSRLFNPVRPSHSLEFWGTYLHHNKIGLDISDWSRYTPEMLARCENDVYLNFLVYQYLLKEGADFGPQSIQIEHSITAILEEASHHGFAFKTQEAIRLLQMVTSRLQTLETDIQSVFPKVPIFDREFKVRYLKNGQPSTANFRWLPPELRENVGDCSRIIWQEFNPGSSKQIITRLKPYWNPVEYTPGSENSPPQPKISEENLNTISDSAPPQANMIREFKLLKNRVSMLNTWIDAVGPDDRIHGKIIHIGANTHRCAHHSPNTANIPATMDKRGRPNLYGMECRALWTVADPSERCLVGVDAKGIQLRILAHLRNNPDFTKQVTQGKPHQYHADLTGYSYEEMKTFIYAFLLGVGKTKAGRIIGGTPEDGATLIKVFLDRNPDLKALRKRMKAIAADGWMTFPDGRWIPIKEEHFALAVALQGFEQLIMKIAIILTVKEIKIEKLDAFLVGFIHDETQWDSSKKDAKRVGELMKDSIRKAGEILKLNCPMDGDIKIGSSWAETH